MGIFAQDPRPLNTTNGRSGVLKGTKSPQKYLFINVKKNSKCRWRLVFARYTKFDSVVYRNLGHLLLIGSALVYQ